MYIRSKGLRSLLAVVICVVTAAFFMVPATASAKDMSFYETDADNTYYTKIGIDPYVYYDIGGGKAKKFEDGFLYNLVKDKLLDDYVEIANACFKTSGKCATINVNEFDKRFNTNSTKTDCFGDIREYLKDKSTATNKGTPQNDNMRKTGLLVTSNLQDVRQTMADEIVAGLGRKTVHASDILAQAPDDKGALSEMDKDNNTTAIYSIVTSIDRKSLGGLKYDYNSFGICFYDFAAVPITADNLDYKTALDGYKSLDEAIEKGASGVTYDTSSSDGGKAMGAKNDTNGKVNVTVSASDNKETAVTNHFEKSEQIGYEESTDFSLKWGCNLGATMALSEFVWNFGFKFTQMYTTTEGTSKEERQGRTETSSASVELPANSSSMIALTNTNSTANVKYDTPVQISYKVAIFSITGQVYADSGYIANFSTAGYEHGYYLNVLGGNSKSGVSANENLQIRAIENYKTSTKDTANGTVHRYWKNNGGSQYNTTNQGVNWKDTAFTGNTATKNAVANQAKNIPMLSGGCNYDVLYNAVLSEIRDATPLYLPRKFVRTKGEGEYMMTVGDKLNLSKQMGVDCLNKNDIPYCAFAETDGKWELCDENGTVTDTSDVLEIVTATGGDRILRATAPGKAYFTWQLADNITYKAEDEAGIVNRDSNLPTPIVEVEVKAVPFEGTIEVTGGENFNGCVGDEGLNLNDVLDVAVYDSTGKEVPEPYEWEQKELQSRGIKVDANGDVEFTKPGTFHVRAIVRNTDSGEDDVLSNWCEIIARDKRELTSVQFDTETLGDINLLVKRPDHETHSYDLKSYTKGYDQYGEPWTGSLDDVNYAMTKTAFGYIDENDMLVINGDGHFKVKADIAGIDDEPTTMAIKATDNLKLKESSIKVACGKTKTLYAYNEAGKRVTKGLNFKSGANGVAKVSAKGVITPVKPGKAKITVTDDNGNHAECTVTVVKGTQKLKIKSSKRTIKTSKSLKAKKLTVKGAKTKLKFSKVSGSKKLTINKKTGVISVKKGTPNGTYTIKVKAYAAKSSKFKAGKAVKKIKVVVKR